MIPASSHLLLPFLFLYLSLSCPLSLCLPATLSRLSLSLSYCSVPPLSSLSLSGSARLSLSRTVMSLLAALCLSLSLGVSLQLLPFISACRFLSLSPSRSLSLTVPLCLSISCLCVCTCPVPHDFCDFFLSFPSSLPLSCLKEEGRDHWVGLDVIKSKKRRKGSFSSACPWGMPNNERHFSGQSIGTRCNKTSLLGRGSWQFPLTGAPGNGWPLDQAQTECITVEPLEV